MRAGIVNIINLVNNYDSGRQTKALQRNTMTQYTQFLSRVARGEFSRGNRPATDQSCSFFRGFNKKNILSLYSEDRVAIHNTLLRYYCVVIVPTTKF